MGVRLKSAKIGDAMQFSSMLFWDFWEKLKSLALRYWIVIRTENSRYQWLVILYLVAYALINVLAFVVLPRVVILDPTTTLAIRFAAFSSGLLGLYLSSKIQEALVGFTPFGGWVGRFYGLRFWNSDVGRNVVKCIGKNLASGWQLVQEPLQPSFAAVTNLEVNNALLLSCCIPVSNQAERVSRWLRKSYWRIRSTEWLAYTEEHGPTAAGVQDDLRRFVILGAQGLQSNDRKIRLARDLVLQDGKFEPVEVERTDYVSSLMTDGLSFSRINHVPFGGARQLTDGLNHFFDPQTGLHPLSLSRNSNQIGASTIAFTKDGVCVVLLQTSANQYSGNTYVPTGSGSIDWADAEYCSDPTNLISIVEYGALRELTEECGIRKRVRRYLKPYAFCRLVHRGGKPEFFFVCLIDEKFETINRWQVKRAERRFTNKYTENIDLAKLRTINFDALDLAAEIRRVYDAIRDSAIKNDLTVSYQLEHGLLLLEQVCSTSVGTQELQTLFNKRSPTVDNQRSWWSRFRPT